jgi:hypothetical protein
MKRFVWIVGFWLALCAPAFAVSVTKTRTSIWSGVTLAAGTPQTSSAVNINTSFECQVNMKITNGATGPTVPAQIQVQVANDTTPTLLINYGGALVGTSTNSDVTYFSVTLPIGLAQMKLVGSANTAQSVTLDADISCATGIASIEAPFTVAAR